VEAELDNDFEWMHGLDRQAFRVHQAMAVHLGDAERAELEERYRFHMAVQDIHGQLVAHSRHVQITLNALAGQRQVEQGQFQQALAALRGAHEELEAQLNIARGLLLPPLKNMTAGAPLGPFLLSELLVRSLHSDTQSLDGAWINRLMTQMGEVIDRTARILFKSLGGILTLQEGIAERWTAAQAKPAAPAETPPVDAPPLGEST
jgi:hypothetical protein